MLGEETVIGDLDQTRLLLNTDGSIRGRTDRKKRNRQTDQTDTRGIYVHVCTHA